MQRIAAAARLVRDDIEILACKVKVAYCRARIAHCKRMIALYERIGAWIERSICLLARRGGWFPAILTAV